MSREAERREQSELATEAHDVGAALARLADPCHWWGAMRHTVT